MNINCGYEVPTLYFFFVDLKNKDTRQRELRPPVDYLQELPVLLHLASKADTDVRELAVGVSSTLPSPPASLPPSEKSPRTVSASDV